MRIKLIADSFLAALEIFESIVICKSSLKEMITLQVAFFLKRGLDVQRIPVRIEPACVCDFLFINLDLTACIF